MALTIRAVEKYIRDAITVISESHTFRDKLTLLRYYLNAPFFMINHMRGKHNPRLLLQDVIIKNKYGIFFCDRNLYYALGFSSLVEPKIKEFLIKNNSDGVFVDIGANGGMHTIPSARNMQGKVIAIEPEPKNFEILKKNIKLNGLKNVIALNKGCFSKKGKLTFYLDDGGIGGHSFINKEIGHRHVKINVDTLDNILKNLKIKRVDLIKIDVEGAETDVLKGAMKTLKSSHPKIVFEAWDEKYLRKIEKILKPLNYKVVKIAEENYLAT